MNATVLNNTDIAPLEEILLDAGQMRVVDYAAIKDFSQNDISLFCHKHAIYQIITTELINFVKKEIGDDKAIEIGAGNGCFGRALGIPITDNCLQERADIKAYYNLIIRQPTIKYPQDIIRYDGNLALEKLKPEVIIASWVTQQSNNPYGVNEISFLGRIKKYIHVGNEQSHAGKEILKLMPVTTHRFDWLVSRSLARDKNLIYIFNCAK